MSRRSLCSCLVACVLAAGSLAAATVLTLAGTQRPAGAATPGPSVTPRGYWLGAADGGIFSFGDAAFKGSAGGAPLNRPVVGMAATPSGNGYWLVASDGGIFSYGDAAFLGSTGSIHLASPIVGMAASPSGNGYWLVAADGGVFAFGDAPFKGSMGGKKLVAPIVGIAPTPGGQGYWMVASDGGIFTFGDAHFLGSQGAKPLNRPIVGMASTPSGNGYWMVASDGGIFTFGDAGFLGSTGAIHLNRPIVGMASTPSGNGYWVVASDGGIFTFGDAAFFGSAGNIALTSPVVGMASVPRRHPAETTAFYYPWWGNPQFEGQYVHWDEGNNDPPWDIGADFYPSRDTYSSADPTVLSQQFAEIAAAGIDEVVVSWWGQGSYEDNHLAGVTEAATANHVRVGIHLEPYAGRTAATVASDITHLKTLGYRDFWIYEAMSLPGDQLQGVNDAAGDVRIMAETGDINAVRNGTFVAWATAAHFSGVYTYDPVRLTAFDLSGICGQAHQHSLLCAPAASPGFEALRSSQGAFTAVVQRNNGGRYDFTWQAVISAAPDISAITSYNEWHEGSQIEPAKGGCFPSGTCYLNYEGAYGQSGTAAESAYMGRTRFWTDRYHATGS